MSDLPPEAEQGMIILRERGMHGTADNLERIISEQAAALEARHRVALYEQIRNLENTVSEQAAKLEAVREYMTHKPGCMLGVPSGIRPDWTVPVLQGRYPCTCGLDTALAGVDGGNDD